MTQSQAKIPCDPARSPPPRRACSSIHSSACVAVVSLLFALTDAFLRYPCGQVLCGLEELGCAPERPRVRAPGVVAQYALVQLCRGGGLRLGGVEVGQVADRLVDVHRVVVVFGLLVAGDNVQRVQVLELGEGRDPLLTRGRLGRLPHSPRNPETRVTE